MSSILKSVIIMAVALTLGKLCGVIVSKSRYSNRDKEYHILKEVQKYALTILVPISSLLALWIAKLDNVRYLAIPFLGIAFMLFANMFGRLVTRFFAEPKKKSAVFGASAFSNLGTLGRLASFMLFGEAAMGYLPLFRMSEMFFMIAVGFSTIQSIQSGKKVSNKKILQSIKDPIIVATFLALIIGVALNFSKIERPNALDKLNEYIVPLVSFVILFTIGYRLKVTKVFTYVKGVAIVSAVKMLLLPATMVLLCFVIGLNNTSPLACKTMVLLSGMPPAFLSVTAAQLYDGDVDMANSILLIVTILMFAWLPLAGAILPLIFG